MKYKQVNLFKIKSSIPIDIYTMFEPNREEATKLIRTLDRQYGEELKLLSIDFFKDEVKITKIKAYDRSDEL
jgi:hypothetical protein